MIPTPQTPMMAQWAACKEKSIDALLLFRLGDFYEAFHEDARIISQALGLTLTQRQGIPMCGVPCHAHELYLDKLIKLGHKVAVAEQTEEAKNGKGLVKREISRICTSGTVMNSQLIEDKKNNYIASLILLGQIYGLSILDVTTGDFFTLELDQKDDLINELCRIRPTEFLTSKAFVKMHPQFFLSLSNAFCFRLNEKETSYFDPSFALSTLLRHFQVMTLDSFGLKGQNASIIASGSLLSYLKDELNLPLNHVVSIQSEALSQYMAIDRSTLRNLEIIDSQSEDSKQNTLLSYLDSTCTPMGARLLRQWLKYPLMNVSMIEERQDAIADCLAHFENSKQIQYHLASIRDLERLTAKVVARYASPRDLWTLGLSLERVPLARQEMQPFSSSLLQRLKNALADISELSREICSSLIENPPIRLSDGDLFRRGVYPELDHLYQISRESVHWMNSYQNELREKTGIKTLKVGFTKVFGYYIEVSRAKGENIPEGFQRSQTLVNAERFVTQELKEHEQKVRSADEKAKALESALFESLREKIAGNSALIRQIAQALAHIDTLLSLTVVAKENNLTRPKIDTSAILSIHQGRHPIVERFIGAMHFIPNDTLLNHDDRRLILLTGPNMAGKSTYIRQVALIVILAQMGSFVPAESAHIGVIDKVFSRVGASDDLARGQSTFMVEMSETAHILRQATSRSLVILDEIGRGTSTYDGISIAWAVAEYLLKTKDKQAKTLFATHYWELTELEKDHPGAVNLHVAVQETSDGIVFLRKIAPGGTDRSYGIHVAKLAGLPISAIQRAEELLCQLESLRGKEKSRPLPRKEKKPEPLSLFESFILEKIRQIDCHQITPLQALQILNDLQKIASSS